MAGLEATVIPSTPEGGKEGKRSLSQKSLKSTATSLATSETGLSYQTSLNSQFTEISNTSFTELVTITEEGHPYIDINTLIYNPVKRQNLSEDDINSKESFWRYVPDFAFIVFNLTSLCVSTYFFLIGTSTLTWKASIGMFAIPSCLDLVDENRTRYKKLKNQERINNFYYLPCKRFTVDSQGDFSADKGYDFEIPNSFPIFRTKLTDVHYFGLALIILALVNVINVMVGINACLQGYKAILIQHIAVDCLIVLSEFVICAVVAFTSICDIRDLRAVRVILKNFVQWYGITTESPEDESDKEKLIAAELDALQIGLGCCGVDGFADYLAARFPESDWFLSRSQLDESDMVIPFSCCRSWWIRNIYCSHGAHLWAHPLATEDEANKLQERIVPEGCIYKLEKLCLNLRSWMGYYGFIATLVHFFVIIIEAIAAIILIRNINNLIREKKKLMRKQEMLHEEGDSELDASISISSREGKKSQWSNVAPPTEDEIVLIKQRSNFNSFMSRVKFGYVGDWMREAQALVTEGHEKKEEEISAEEKKQREKHLLHSKAKPTGQGEKEDHHHAKGKGKRKPHHDDKKVTKGDQPESGLEPTAGPTEVAPKLQEIVEPPPFKLAKETENEIDAMAAKYNVKGKSKKNVVILPPSPKEKKKVKGMVKQKKTKEEIPKLTEEQSSAEMEEPSKEKKKAKGMIKRRKTKEEIPKTIEEPPVEVEESPKEKKKSKVIVKRKKTEEEVPKEPIEEAPVEVEEPPKEKKTSKDMTKQERTEEEIPKLTEEPPAEVEEPPPHMVEETEEDDEPPPLTDEEPSQTETTKAKRRRRRMRKRRGERPPWYKNW